MVGDLYRLLIACRGISSLMLHCFRNGRPSRDVPVTMENVAVVSEVFVDIIAFNKIQEAKVICMDPDGTHMLNGRILFTE